jgi:hypothetical protein
MKAGIFTFIFSIAFICSINAQTFQWARSVGVSDIDIGRSIVTDASGNVYTTGVFRGNIDFDPGAATYYLNSLSYSGAFILKLDAAGNFVWAKALVGNNIEANGIALDASNNVYTTGFFSGSIDFDPGSATATKTSVGLKDVFISKLDVSGNYISAIVMGSTDDDSGNGITLDASGNIYVIGNYSDTLDFDPGPGVYKLGPVNSDDIFISKLSPAGNLVWVNSIGGSLRDNGWSIALDAFGNVYTTGMFKSSVDFDPGPGTYSLNGGIYGDIFVCKLSAAGSFVWAISFGGTGDDRGHSILTDVSGNIYVTGYFKGTADFDTGPGTANLTSVGGTGDVFILKLDMSGNYTWAKGFGTAQSDYGNGIALDNSGNIYTTGSFSGAGDFDPGPDSTVLSCATGYNDIFISKLDNSGNFMWAYNLGDTEVDVGNGITIDASSNILTTGSFMLSPDFDLGPATYNLNCMGSPDIYVLKMGSGPLGINGNTAEDLISIYPNPANDKLNVTVSFAGNKKQLEIYSMTGQRICKMELANGQSFIDISNMSKGIYLIKIMSDDGIFAVKKIIKE